MEKNDHVKSFGHVTVRPYVPLLIAKVTETGAPLNLAAGAKICCGNRLYTAFNYVVFSENYDVRLTVYSYRCYKRNKQKASE